MIHRPHVTCGGNHWDEAEGFCTVPRGAEEIRKNNCYGDLTNSENRVYFLLVRG